MKPMYFTMLACLMGIGATVHAGVDYTRGGVAMPADFDERYTLNSANPANLQWVTDPAGSGRTVLFARVLDSEGNSAGAKRTEISPKNEYVKEGVRWYTFSFYLPANWQFHAYDTGVAQLHTSQKTAIVSPPVVFVILGNKLVLSRHRPYLSQPVSKANSSTVDSVISTVRTNEWNCIVVRADWSSTANVGSLDIWLNGLSVLAEKNQHNAYPTWLGNYPKAGLYMPGKMGVSKREIYMDFIHMGDAQASYAEMYARTPCGE